MRFSSVAKIFSDTRGALVRNLVSQALEKKNKKTDGHLVTSEREFCCRALRG